MMNKRDMVFDFIKVFKVEGGEGTFGEEWAINTYIILMNTITDKKGKWGLEHWLLQMRPPGVFSKR